MLYESHITLSIKDAVLAQRVADEYRWKTSQIARDITLGEDTYFYLTTHSPKEDIIRTRLWDTVEALKACRSDCDPREDRVDYS